MKHFKNHWRILSTALLVVVGGGGAIWWYGCNRMTPTAYGQPGEGGHTALGDVAQDGIESVLDHLSLDHAALVALNPAAVDAETILSTARVWYITNEPTLATLQANIDQAVAAVRQQQAAIAMGPPQEGQDEALATAVQNLVTARTAYDSAFDPLRISISNELSTTQQAVWAAIQQGLGQRMPIRMLSLTTQQRLDLSKAWHHYEWQRGAATDADELAAAVSAWDTAVATILTTEQETTLTSFVSDFGSSSDVVAGAWATVFPTESES